ncbi:MAG: hypothetical protein ACQESE_03505 [Nanobdellota archaeon]
MEINKNNFVKRRLEINYFPKTGSQGTYELPIYIINNNFIIGKGSEQKEDFGLTGIITDKNLGFVKVPQSTKKQSVFWIADDFGKGEYEGSYDIYTPSLHPVDFYNVITGSYDHFQEGIFEIDPTVISLANRMRTYLQMNPDEGRGIIRIK